MASFVILPIHTLTGDLLFECTAFLKARPPSITANTIYGNADGAGTSKFKKMAILKATMEAIERAAYEEFKGSGKYGLSTVPCSAGFAAYPGIGNGEVRDIASAEAAERWCIAAWWEKKLAHKLIYEDETRNYLSIENPFGIHVIVTWNKSGKNRAYGFGAAKNIRTATYKSDVECSRNLRALGRAGSKMPSSRCDKRLIYFNTPQGVSDFERRLRSAPTTVLSTPKKVWEGEIPTQYPKAGIVWRTIYEPISSHYIDDSIEDYFYF